MGVTLNSKTYGTCFLIELESGVLVFVEGGKPENPEKTLGTGMRTSTELNSHLTPGSGIEFGPQLWEASAVTTAPYPCTSSLLSGSCNKMQSQKATTTLRKQRPERYLSLVRYLENYKYNKCTKLICSGSTQNDNTLLYHTLARYESFARSILFLFLYPFYDLYETKLIPSPLALLNIFVKVPMK